MINKKNVLGKEPEELGVRDAVHTAIVAVRAAVPIKPGTRCGLNEHREAIPKKNGPGIADPMRKCAFIPRGGLVWLILDQDEVPNVQHMWEHPTIDFSPPTREVVHNKVLSDAANELGLTYEQLMSACKQVVETDKPVLYPGTKALQDVQEIMGDISYDLWQAWAAENFYEFPNDGSDCCPEYQYPGRLFLSKTPKGNKSE